MSVKQVCLDLLDPTLSGPYNWTTSLVVPGPLVSDIHRWTEFQSGDHDHMKKDGLAVIKLQNANNYMQVLNMDTGKLPSPQELQLWYGGKI